MNILIFPYARIMRDGKKHPKNYPWWPELIELLTAQGHTVIQCGVEGETQLVDDFRKNLSIAKLEQLIHSCDTWIGVDSFGQHFAWSINRPGIVLFGQSDPLIFGHPENINLLKDRKYLRDRQFWLWEQCEANDAAFVSPSEVVEALQKNFSN